MTQPNLAALLIIAQLLVTRKPPKSQPERVILRHFDVKSAFVSSFVYQWAGATVFCISQYSSICLRCSFGNSGYWLGIPFSVSRGFCGRFAQSPIKVPLEFRVQFRPALRIGFLEVEPKRPVTLADGLRSFRS